MAVSIFSRNSGCCHFSLRVVDIFSRTDVEEEREVVPRILAWYSGSCWVAVESVRMRVWCNGVELDVCVF